MKMGFIGLGTMGAGIAHNAIKGGHELVVNDLGRNAAASHLEAGAQWADTPREVAERSQIVFTSLPGRFDPADFALALARKDVTLALEVGEEFQESLPCGVSWGRF